MSEIEANRSVLRERIRNTGYVGSRDWSNRQPLVTVDEFFAEGVNDLAIGSARISAFGIAAFAALLRETASRDEVSAVAIEIDDDFDDGWPHRDYVFVATSCDADKVASWFSAIPPDVVLPAARGGPWVKARIIRLEDIRIKPGHELWALKWKHD